MRQVGNDVEIFDGRGNVLTVEGIALAQMQDADNFLF